MTLNFKILLLFNLLAFASCSIHNRDNIDYIIYGTYAGECMGHCSLMFKLDTSKLFVDTTGSFFNNWEKTVTFNNDTLSREDFLNAQDIRQKLPTLLLTSSSTSFGRPDGYDQGGIFVQFKIDKEIKTFYIDVDKDKIPSGLRNFAELIESKVTSKWDYYYR